ncbi:MAG: hypothetical protein ACI8Q1_001063 [Parvicella sp.]|jgi:hypothetical protein
MKPVSTGELIPINNNSNIFIYNETIVVNPEQTDKDNNISVDFGIVNATSEKITIIEVNPHCSCTGYELEEEYILPYDTTFLNLKVSLEQLKMLKKTYATIKIDHEKKYLLARIKLDDE